jgi:hypothetical protein
MKEPSSIPQDLDGLVEKHNERIRIFKERRKELLNDEDIFTGKVKMLSVADKNYYKIYTGEFIADFEKKNKKKNEKPCSYEKKLEDLDLNNSEEGLEVVNPNSIKQSPQNLITTIVHQQIGIPNNHDNSQYLGKLKKEEEEKQKQIKNDFENLKKGAQENIENDLQIFGKADELDLDFEKDNTETENLKNDLKIFEKTNEIDLKFTGYTEENLGDNDPVIFKNLLNDDNEENVPFPADKGFDDDGKVNNETEEDLDLDVSLENLMKINNITLEEE